MDSGFRFPFDVKHFYVNKNMHLLSRFVTVLGLLVVYYLVLS
jgi:hypothetical protein